jgi:hypothetical protein
MPKTGDKYAERIAALEKKRGVFGDNGDTAGVERVDAKLQKVREAQVRAGEKAAAVMAKPAKAKREEKRQAPKRSKKA